VKLFLVFWVLWGFILEGIPSGYLAEGPGSSFDLQEKVEVKGAETWNVEGEVMLTSVSFREAGLLDHVLALGNEEERLVRVKDFLGESLDVEGRELVDKLDTLLSRDTALVVALEQLGIPVEYREEGVLVTGVVRDFPACGVLHPGDVIIAVNGERVRNVEELREVTGALEEGAVLELEIVELGEEMDEEDMDDLDALFRRLKEKPMKVTVETAWDPGQGRVVMGVTIQDFFTYRADVSVEWNMGDVRGPSAGLPMALALYNLLTPEDVTGGRKIAGTGVIRLDGSVGPIGGLPMKIRAAEAAGAEIFFYPLDNQGDLEGIHTALELHAVTDFRDVLRALGVSEAGVHVGEG
jgi:PDZ domain-containing protein